MRDRTLPVFLPIIRQDIRDITRWSEKNFGRAASDRYVALIQQAFRDLYEDPLRAGTKSRPDLARHAFVYHLAFSRDRVAGERVKAPRHFVLYRFAGMTVEFARVLHDSRDLARHLPTGYLREEPS